MTKEKSEIYKCNVCGNVVEVLLVGGGELVCCGQPMKLLKAKTEDVGMEKHVPVVTIKGDKIRVEVGSIEHPMEEKHYITLIEVLGDGQVIAGARLNPGEKPEAEFHIKNLGAYRISARELCNIHDLWASE